MSKYTAISLSLSLLLMSACAAVIEQRKQRDKERNPVQASPLDDQFKVVSETFYWEYLDARPTLGVYLGYHQYDGKLPDASADGIEREVERLKSSQKMLRQFPEAGLNETHRLEREVLLFAIREELFNLTVLRRPWSDPMNYSWAISLQNYIERDYAPLEDRARAVIAVSAAMGRLVGQIQLLLEQEMPRTWIETALMEVKGNIEFASKDVRAAFAELNDEVLRGRVSKAIDQYVAALTKQQNFLESRLVQATDKYALGEARFLQMLADTQGVRLDVAALEAVAQADLERNWKALEAVAKSIDATKPVAEVVKQLNAERPAAADLLDTARGQLDTLYDFVRDNDIVTIPSGDPILVKESPPFMRWNFAFLNATGPFETASLPAYYYITLPDPSWSEADQAAYVPAASDLLSTSIHEVWPGHFVDSLHRKKITSPILKTFWNYCTGEGWAHYTEEMMWEAGVSKDPKVHVGILLNALLRDVRFLSAIGLHAKGMTVAESAKLFEEKGLQDAATAKQQSVRGTFDPMYLSYTLGKLMIMTLHEDWKTKEGAKYSRKRFHDTFLSYGGVPVPVIRGAMLGENAGSPLNIPGTN